MHDQIQMEHPYTDDCLLDFKAELKEAAWNILHENPGCDRQDWIDELISQYPAEVVDALGNNPHEVYPALEDWWDCEEFEDAQTGFNKRFCEWAEYFVTERSVELYDLLAEARHEINLTRSTLD